jgi:hypothetical protein
LTIEHSPVQAILAEEYRNFKIPGHSNVNAFTAGRIGEHHVIIAQLDRIGDVAAAHAAKAPNVTVRHMYAATAALAPDYGF